MKNEVENWLDSRGVEYEAAVINVDDIDENRSRNNQARLEVSDKETVGLYAAAMARGDKFPPLVVVKRGKGYTIVDGVHRYYAAKQYGSDTLGVYVVDATQAAITELTYEANTRNGRPNTKEERYAHAVHLRSLGVSNADTAARCGLTKTDVTNAVAAHEANQRASDLDVRPGFHRLSPVVRRDLNRIRFDVPFTRLANAVLARPIPLSEQKIRSIVKSVVDATSESAMIRMVDTEMAALSVNRIGNRSGVTIPWANAIRKHLAAVSKAPPAGWVVALDDEVARKELHGQIQTAIEALMERQDDLDAA